MNNILPLKRAAEWLGLPWGTAPDPRLSDDSRRMITTNDFSEVSRNARVVEGGRNTAEEHPAMSAHEEDGVSKSPILNAIPETTLRTEGTHLNREQEDKRTLSAVMSLSNNDRVSESTQTYPRFSDQDAQLVTINQNGVETYALTLTAELAEQFQTNVLCYHQVEDMDKRRRMLNSKVQEIEEQIEDSQDLLRELSEKQLHSSEENSKVVENEIRDLLRQKQSLEGSLEEFTEALENQHIDLQAANLAKRSHEGVLYDLMKHPLQACGVLGREEPTGTPDMGSINVRLENEYSFANEYCDETESEESPTASELLKLNVYQELFEREAAFEKAKEHFDGFNDEYNKNLAEYYEDIAAGVHNIARTAFDNFYVEGKRQYTRELIDAEAKLRETRRQARQVGIKQDALDESIFQNDPHDGYGESMENDMIYSAPVARIEAWLDEVPDKICEESAANSMPLLECDDWEARSVHIGDSVS
ncbi:MAG: hypothetical protein Q9157_002312 [Trypethelium eluteriae]